jgi:hypothetical protein
MRVNKSLKLIWVFFLIFAIQFASVKKAVASDTLGFGQSILPVCLVYLTPGGAIFNIWSNVSQLDNLYVIKFIDQDSEELPLSENLLAQYIQKSQKDVVKRDKTEITQFLNNNNSIEEVRTIV